jgi:hypothetical protein
LDFASLDLSAAYPADIKEDWLRVNLLRLSAAYPADIRT